MEITITSINFVYQNGLSGAITGVRLSFNTSTERTYVTSGYITITLMEYFASATSMEGLSDIVREKLIADLEETASAPAGDGLTVEGDVGA